MSKITKKPAADQGSQIVNPRVTEVAVANELLDEMAAGAGNNDISMQDVALPYLLVLQSLSPQLKRSSPKYIEGASEGDIYNTVTQEVISGEDGVDIVPAAFQRSWVEWKPRDIGGGWVASHNTDAILADCVRDDKGYDVHRVSKNVIVPTYYYYVVLVRDDKLEPAIVAMSRTQMKVGRRWNSLITSHMVRGPRGLFNPPIYAQLFHLGTEPETNAKGEWAAWKVSPKGLVANQELYRYAKLLHESVKSNTVRATAMPPEHDDADTDAAF